MDSAPRPLPSRLPLGPLVDPGRLDLGPAFALAGSLIYRCTCALEWDDYEGAYRHRTRCAQHRDAATAPATS